MARAPNSSLQRTPARQLLGPERCTMSRRAGAAELKSVRPTEVSFHLARVSNRDMNCRWQPRSARIRVIRRVFYCVAFVAASACNSENALDSASFQRESPVAPIDSVSAKPVTPSPARMIIRNATMSLVVRDAVDVLRKVTALIETSGGYVAETKQWKEREQVRAVATVRVPAAQLSPVLAAIRGYAVRVESENVTAQDVSQEYTDLAAQLRNLQVTETELRELLKTVRERTQKASEVMEVFNEVSKVRGEIERIQGRLQYFSQMTTLSTISVELVPDILAAPLVEPGWQPVATVKAATRGLVNALKSVIDALIWLTLYLLPLGVVFAALALVIRAIWLWLRKQRPNERPAA